jgi:hypothetical protein
MPKHTFPLVVLAGAVALAAGAANDPFSKSQGVIEVAVYGDAPYGTTPTDTSETIATPAFIQAVNAADPQFIVHVGDIHSGKQFCTTAYDQQIYQLWTAYQRPLVYTPGDNEWTDCHEGQGVRGGDPLERLRALRETFFRNPEALGRRKMPLERQSGEYPENARWERGGIVFLTLHVPGSNNGRGRSPGGDVEFAARNRADMAWLRAGFERAKTSGARAVMIVQQANMYPEYPPFPGEGPKEPSGFTELRTLLAREALAFGKPVVLVHGDSHYFRVDKPLARRSSSPMVENLTRVETFGSPYHHWVEVSVDPADANVFTFRPRIVAANLKGGK